MNLSSSATIEGTRAGEQWVDSTATKSQLMNLLRERAICSDLGGIFPAHGTARDGIVASLTRIMLADPTLTVDHCADWWTVNIGAPSSMLDEQYATAFVDGALAWFDADIEDEDEPLAMRTAPVP